MFTLSDSRQGDVTEVEFGMQDDCLPALTEFGEKEGHKFKSVPTPYAPELTDAEVSALVDQPGRFQDSCAHYLMQLLYAARQAKPDIIVAITRLASFITRWNANCDRKLIRLFDYLWTHKQGCLKGSLDVSDASTLVVKAWPDADLAGDKDSSTKSTSGRFVEVSGASGLCMPIQWATHKQGGSAHSTPEAETVSLSDCLRLDAIPIQQLFSLI